MSLRYRLIILAVLVFAATFGAGTLLAVHSARRLAQGQLVSHLERAARALAESGAPVNSADMLQRYEPLLDAQIMVVGKDGRLLAHGGSPLAWEKLNAARASFVQAGSADAPPLLAVEGGGFYFAQAARRLPAPDDQLLVCTLADQRRLEESTQLIFNRYLLILGVTAVLLCGGMYIIGHALVRRLKRLNAQLDSAFAEGQTQRRRRGDEIARLGDSFQDLMERLETSRQRLLAQQRLATTGKLASSVAHEVRNPLQAMRLTVQMLREKCPADQRPGCDLVVSEIDRLALLTDELLVLAGKDTADPQPLDLSRELAETLRLLKFQFRQRDISAQADIPALPPVRMDRNRCRQLLLNLLLNASEAGPRGGTIRITASAADGQVALTIADDGPGFPPAVLAGQTEEFFSTKSSGAGLGLSICRRIVEEAAGELALSNSPDGGAVAKVRLPAS